MSEAPTGAAPEAAQVPPREEAPAPKRRRGDLAIAARQVRFEQKAFWRNPAAAVFTFAFPVLFLVVFATLNSGERIRERGGLDYVTFYVPGIVAFGVITACYTNLAMRVVISRDLGVLKRVRGTPVPSWVYLGAQVGSSLVTSILLVVVTIGLGVGLYGVAFRTSTAPGLVAALVLGAACFSALGLAIAAVCPNADAAPAIVNFTLFLLLFISGIFFPLDNAPSWVRSLGQVFPIQRLADALQFAFDPRTHGLGFQGEDLAVLALWLAAGTILALRLFRWEPARA